MEQKHFMDIVRIKEEDTELRTSNIKGFDVGDIIVIQEKVDGSNASIRYDVEKKKLISFSRKLELTEERTLNGFWDYVQTLNSKKYEKYSNYVFFGEWLVRNAIRYKQDAYNKWYVYDVYDVEAEEYLPQDMVKELCKELNHIYVKTFYVGEFISWEHCRKFVGQSDIAFDLGEGIIIKNQSKLNNPDEKKPYVLKIVGENFKEVQKSRNRKKILDPQKLKEKELAQDIVDQIVTKRRVQKELYKMRDEGLIPEKIEPEHMKIVAQNLPRRIYDDCLKEELEMVNEAGDFFKKLCCNNAMKYAKELIFGEK